MFTIYLKHLNGSALVEFFNFVFKNYPCAIDDIQNIFEYGVANMGLDEFESELLTIGIPEFMVYNMKLKYLKNVENSKK